MEVGTIEPQHKGEIPFSYLPTNGGQHMAPVNKNGQRPMSVAHCDADEFVYQNMPGKRTTMYVSPQSPQSPPNHNNNAAADYFEPKRDRQMHNIDDPYAFRQHVDMPNQTTYFDYSNRAEDLNPYIKSNKTSPDRPTATTAAAVYAASKKETKVPANVSLASNEIDFSSRRSFYYNRRSKLCRCNGKCVGYAVAILLLILFSYGGGFITGWFVQQNSSATAAVAPPSALPTASRFVTLVTTSVTTVEIIGSESTSSMVAKAVTTDAFHDTTTFETPGSESR